MDDRARGEQRVEPAARLIDPLADEISGERFLEFLLVLERIVPLGGVHRAGIEPGIDDVRHPVHRLAALRADEVDLVDVRAVQLHALRQVLIDRALHQLRTASDGDRLPAVLAGPQVERRPPVTITGEGPVLKVGQEIAEAACADVRRVPVDRRVV